MRVSPANTQNAHRSAVSGTDPAAFLAHFESLYTTTRRDYSESELARAKELVETKFSSDEWTKRIP